MYKRQRWNSPRNITLMPAGSSSGASTGSSLMSSAGHSSSRLTTYDDPALGTSYPLASVAKAAVTSGRAVPETPYWNLVRAAIDESWSPAAKVTVDTPKQSQRIVTAQLRGKLP